MTIKKNFHLCALALAVFYLLRNFSAQSRGEKKNSTMTRCYENARELHLQCEGGEFKVITPPPHLCSGSVCSGSYLRAQAPASNAQSSGLDCQRCET